MVRKEKSVTQNVTVRNVKLRNYKRRKDPIHMASKQGLYDNAPAMVLECRGPAIKVATDIGNYANEKHGKLGAQYAAMIGAIGLQNILVSIAIDTHPPGSQEGEEFLKDFYDKIWLDVKDRWHARDLKHHFGDKPRQKGDS